MGLWPSPAPDADWSLCGPRSTGPSLSPLLGPSRKTCSALFLVSLCCRPDRQADADDLDGPSLFCARRIGQSHGRAQPDAREATDDSGRCHWPGHAEAEALPVPLGESSGETGDGSTRAKNPPAATFSIRHRGYPYLDVDGMSMAGIHLAASDIFVCPKKSAKRGRVKNLGGKACRLFRRHQSFRSFHRRVATATSVSLDRQRVPVMMAARDATRPNALISM